MHFFFSIYPRQHCVDLKKLSTRLRCLDNTQYFLKLILQESMTKSYGNFSSTPRRQACVNILLVGPYFFGGMHVVVDLNGSPKKNLIEKEV